MCTQWHRAGANGGLFSARRRCAASLYFFGELDQGDLGQGIAHGGNVWHPREIDSVAHVVLVNFVERGSVHTIQFEELEPCDRRLRRVRGGAWVHDAGRRPGKCLEAPIHVAEPFCAFVNRHEYTRNAENIVGAIRSEFEVK